MSPEGVVIVALKIDLSISPICFFLLQYEVTVNGI